MYGSLRVFEGCAFFRESISQHTIFKEWYEHMQKAVLNGYEDEKILKNNDSFLNMFSIEDVEVLLKEQLTTTLYSSVIETNKKLEMSNKPENNKKNPAFFRILTINYLIFVIAFSYVSWMAR
jgi:hypothetical protein